MYHEQYIRNDLHVLILYTAWFDCNYRQTNDLLDNVLMQ